MNRNHGKKDLGSNLIPNTHFPWSIYYRSIFLSLSFLYFFFFCMWCSFCLYFGGVFNEFEALFSLSMIQQSRQPPCLVVHCHPSLALKRIRVFFCSSSTLFTLVPLPFFLCYIFATLYGVVSYPFAILTTIFFFIDHTMEQRIERCIKE